MSIANEVTREIEYVGWLLSAPREAPRRLLNRLVAPLGYQTQRSISEIYRNGFSDGQLYERKVRTGYTVDRSVDGADVIFLPVQSGGSASVHDRRGGADEQG